MSRGDCRNLRAGSSNSRPRDHTGCLSMVWGDAHGVERSGNLLAGGVIRPELSGFGSLSSSLSSLSSLSSRRPATPLEKLQPHPSRLDVVIARTRGKRWIRALERLGLGILLPESREPVLRLCKTRGQYFSRLGVHGAFWGAATDEKKIHRGMRWRMRAERKEGRGTPRVTYLASAWDGHGEHGKFGFSPPNRVAS